jgi:hypothetical protein
MDGLILLVGGLVGLELILCGLWVRAYFAHGLLIFKREISPVPVTLGRRDLDCVQAEAAGSWLPDILFKQIGPGEWAFREKQTHG